MAKPIVRSGTFRGEINTKKRLKISSLKQAFNYKQFASAGIIVALVLSVFSLSVRPEITSAADTGFSSANQTIASNSVTAPDNGWASDDARATFNLGSSIADYGFPDLGIPEGSVVNGIEVTVEGQRATTRNLAVSVWNASNSAPDAYTASKTAVLTTGSDSVITLGNGTDKWGKAWLATDFADTSFKIRVQGNGGTGNALLDQIRIKVYFTPAQASAVNPSLSATCGLDVALVMDTSGSISAAELTQMKNAFKGFVSQFLPGTPTQFSVTDFDTSATVRQAFTSNSTLLNTAVDAGASGGNTNWQQGLLKAQGTLPNRANANLVIFASDGNPTYSGDPGQNVDDTQALNDAIIAANSIKNSGTRILALGIGNDLNTANLQAISGADAVYTTNFDSLAADLATLAGELCGGTISVRKVIDQDGDTATTDDQTYQAGWQFTVAGSEQSTDAQGFTQSVPVPVGSYSVSEVSQDGYELAAASCEGSANPGSLSGNTISGISVGLDDIVSCVFYNKPTGDNTPPKGTLVVKKEIVGGQLTFSNFSFVVNNSENPTAFEGDGQNDILVDAGNYSVSELAAANYTATYNNCQDIAIAAGESATCTITNTFREGEGGGEEVPTTTPVTLTVTISDGANDGEGTVTSAPSGISCDSLVADSDCSETFSTTTEVTLTAVPKEGSTFDGSWTTGPCSGSADPVCVFAVSSDMTVNAHFSLVTPSTPTPSPTPPPSGGGGGGGGTSSGGSGIPVPPGPQPTPPPAGQVLGTSATASSITMPASPAAPASDPQPQVLAATDTLPVTGVPASIILISFIVLAGFVPLKRKLA